MKNNSQINNCSSLGRKRRFGLAGIANLVASNVFLQALLALSLPIAFATFFAQAFNALIGYFTYGRIAFNAPIGNLCFARRYAALASFLWVANWGGIKTFQVIGVSRAVGAVVMVAPLAMLSYIIQLKWVFKRP